MRRIFLLIPSPHPTGPVKGAYALANALAGERQITLVTLKPGPGANTALDPRVTQLSLADVPGGWAGRLSAYRKLLRDAGGRHGVASISMCFSADMVNCLAGNEAITCVSVRGNLLKNYRLDYGPPGIPIAVAHLAALRRADHIIAINSAMAAQVRFYARKLPVVIGNFVDETILDPYRATAEASGALRFAFVGTLSARKQPLLAIRALHEIHRRGVDVTLDMIGTGPLAQDVSTEVTRLGLREQVTLHGHLTDPYALMAKADVLVLPSLSEGISRSALEALHLGVPSVLRAVDGNEELITNASQGALFRNDDTLADIMLSVARGARNRQVARTSMVPARFRQKEQARQYLAVVEQDR
jgi:glycosyltransferase involved in cell wall biosynthesis